LLRVKGETSWLLFLLYNDELLGGAYWILMYVQPVYLDGISLVKVKGKGIIIKLCNWR
jgi:hypothetical protein